MLGRIVNGNLKLITENERKKAIITNLTDDQVKFVYGAKEVVYGTQPEYNPETQYLQENSVDNGDTINVSFCVVNLETAEMQEEN